ncbi:MAG: LLM class flavin-dependent oxidoreductase [Acidimicrobiales bacterium]|jgi:alkanesulfonate monooxygenase SsuD/methylene tetrahydromethanopterin reductase-like flavin-dependent oxidoreductase (luciferase family)
MKYGVFVPLVDEFAEPWRAVHVAREAERAGWDGVFVSDLAESAHGPTEADACIIAAAIASTTTTLQLGLVTPAADRRRPWVLARQSAIIDHLSRGRLIFGTGVGYATWHDTLALPDRGAHDGEEDARTSLFEESLAVLLLCWSGAPVRHEGRWMQVDSPPFLPVPLQRPRIPVWVSAEWPRRTPLRRAAHVDGILPVFTGHRDERAPDVEDVRAVRDEMRRLGAPPAHDLALRGALAPEWAPESLDRLRMLENAGATWWFETVRPGESVSSVSERVAAGPPRDRPTGS